jgi:hypothetical protein
MLLIARAGRSRTAKQEFGKDRAVADHEVRVWQKGRTTVDREARIWQRAARPQGYFWAERRRRAGALLVAEGGR